MMVGREGESFDCNPTVYVAVGRNVKQGKSLLEWAVTSFEGRKICLLHVHHPTILVSLLNGKLPESKLKNLAINAYEETDRLKDQKLLNQYLLFLFQMGIQADKVLIEMNNTEKGILKLIAQHRISHLVMGAAADTFLTKKFSEIKSNKAMIVCQQAPLSCHIWFICKGDLIYSRPVGSGSWLTPVRTLSFPLNGGGSTLTHDHVENMNVNADNVCFEHSTRLIEELVSPLDSTTTAESGSSSPLFEKVKLQENLPCSSSSNSLDLICHQNETSDIQDRLEHTLKDVKIWNQKLFEESLNRWRAEEDAFDALHKAVAAESRYKEEMNRRQEIEEVSTTQSQEIQIMKNRQAQSLKELRLIRDHIPELENELSKARCSEKELEDKIIQAVNLMITFKGTRDKLRIEFDSAIRKVNKLMTLANDGPVGISSMQFFGVSFSDIIEATQDFNPCHRIGERRSGSVFKGVLFHSKVAIKMLPSSGSQSDSEFKYEVEVLSRVRHPNLVSLIGACPESRSLVYEYIENGSLEDVLSTPAKIHALLWQTRIRIAIEICSVLVFLRANHSCNVHGNLKPSKILLDPNFVCKISDLGIYNLMSQNENPFTCNNDPEIKAYTDPEILENGVCTSEADVFSFGIILLRLLTARPASTVVQDVKCASERGNLNAVLDLSAGEWPLEQAKKLADLALRCCEANNLDRPDLSSEIWLVLEPLKDLCHQSQSMSTSTSSKSRSQQKVPSHFVCPILQEVMNDPCIAADGFTYEADAIKGWFGSGHKTSPMTNLKLENCDLLPNYALYYAIQEWQQHT
ncbi:U-box domain-containing protein 32-like isoform X1 [Primulina eburnea]|uniref:U-box domain-containing protein 32-like isoform X1 n=2 Tax=Primulina eburnea TaxID=1245227 RepID=UPI003C6C0996